MSLRHTNTIFLGYVWVLENVKENTRQRKKKKQRKIKMDLKSINYLYRLFSTCFTYISILCKLFHFFYSIEMHVICHESCNID